MSMRKILIGALLFLFVGASAQTGKVSFVVEPYLQEVNDSSFRVMWETSSPGKSEVKLGVAGFNVLRPTLDRAFKDQQNTTFHDVWVSGLQVGENYFYQACTIGEPGDTLWGPVTPLYIPDYGKMPVSFAVVGDTQNSPDVWGKLAALIYQEHPSFIVHAGDLVQYGPNKKDWVEEFFWPARNVLRFFPLYPAIGNHEMNNAWYYQYFHLPDPEWFYTEKKGNVLFIFVDTNKDILPGSAQYKKLEQILASSPEAWKIMVHHHPVYVSEEGFYGNTWFQKAVHGDPNEMHLKKLYETYGVDLELNGHAHFYERTWPLMNDCVDPECGVTYITTGGANHEFSKHAANKAWYDARTRDATNHFLYISIVNNSLYGMAIDSAGHVFDTWTIKKRPGYQRLNAPYLQGDKQYFMDSTAVIIKNMNNRGELFFQTGSEGFKSGKGGNIKLSFSETTNLSAYVQDGEQKSHVAEKTFVKLPVYPAQKKAIKGVKAEYAEGNWIWVPDFKNITPLKIFSLDSLSLKPVQPRAKDHFAVRFTGSFSVPETDVYRFLLESFDGSRLFIDGKEVINDDGIHYEIKKENYIALEKGLHSFEVRYFDYVRRETLNLWIGTQTGEMKDFNTFINR